MSEVRVFAPRFGQTRGSNSHSERAARGLRPARSSAWWI